MFIVQLLKHWQTCRHQPGALRFCAAPFQPSPSWTMCIVCTPCTNHSSLFLSLSLFYHFMCPYIIVYFPMRSRLTLKSKYNGKIPGSPSTTTTSTTRKIPNQYQKKRVGIISASAIRLFKVLKDILCHLIRTMILFFSSLPSIHSFLATPIYYYVSWMHLWLVVHVE